MRDGLAKTWFISIVFILVSIQTSLESRGDRSETFRRCYVTCFNYNCSDSAKLNIFYSRQSKINKLLLWSCPDECRYECMWETTEYFISSWNGVPQFFGKWPFIRIFGSQEPASVLASILNGLVLYIAWTRFKKQVPNIAPMYNVVYVMAMVGINAWFWSAIFHCRDYPLTEKLDYYSALSLVLYSLYTVCIRFVGTDSLLKSSLCSGPFLLFFAYHVHYLTFVSFDYGYHIKVNIITGVVNSLGWFLWCYANRRKSYVWKCLATVTAIDLLLLFELFDFPPIFWVFDAHSLWHFGTIPLPLLWYSFLADDCMDLLRLKTKKV